MTCPPRTFLQWSQDCKGLRFAGTGMDGGPNRPLPATAPLTITFFAFFLQKSGICSERSRFQGNFFLLHTNITSQGEEKPHPSNLCTYLLPLYAYTNTFRSSVLAFELLVAVLSANIWFYVLNVQGVIVQCAANRPIAPEAMCASVRSTCYTPQCSASLSVFEFK